MKTKRRIISKLSQRELWARTVLEMGGALRLDHRRGSVCGWVEATGLGIAWREKIHYIENNCQDDGIVSGLESGLEQ